MITAYPFARPLYVMTKPAGSSCNLACDYCYYLDKGNMYEHKKQEMTDSTLDTFIRQYIEAQTTPEVLFTWHGGEALLRPISFYQKALTLQEYYSKQKGIQVLNSLQTNGTLLNDEWCQFLKEHNFLVGISLDGPQVYHDTYRRNKAGQPSFDKVIRGLRLLQKYKVDFNILAVVNSQNANDPLGFYRFLKSTGCKFIQFAPIVERSDESSLVSILTHKATLTKQTITPKQWGDFLITLFDEWVHNDVGVVFVQLFDATLANWVGEAPGLCTLGKYCGHAGVIEYNGDLYSCDHFVFPEFRLGNIHTSHITEMMNSPVQIAFGQNKYDSLPHQCLECEYLFACNGECPKNRFTYTTEGEPGLNYLCEGFYRFFDHVAPYMDWMKKALLKGQAPANITEYLKAHSLKPSKDF